MLESLRGDGCYGSVNKTVEFFAGRERQFDVALADALLHPASSVLKVIVALGPSLTSKPIEMGFVLVSIALASGLSRRDSPKFPRQHKG